MKKIESIAYLYASMMNSDDKIATKELESWYKAARKRWPEVTKEDAGNTLKNTLYFLKSQSSSERINNLEIVLKELKTNLKKTELDNLAKDLSDLIQSDGKITVGEINLAGLLRWKLGTDINFN
ncbi:MAG: hypothetical protein CMF94_01405 [Candidatus Marinimicrobia bacterium]|nr:hypothetical protein [Candidatus Neomarinimicrobiota bacterium]